MKKIPFTHEEDQIILDAVAAAKTVGKGITNALKDAANVLPNRTYFAISGRYYEHLNKSKRKKKNTQERSTSWLPEEDTILSSAVLGCIASGKTKRAGFRIAEKNLNRTFAAIEKHWRTDLSPNLVNEIEEAKQRAGKSEVKREKLVEQEKTSQFNTETAVEVLQSIIGFVQSAGSQNEVDVLKKQLSELQTNYNKLEKEHKQLQHQYGRIQSIIEHGKRIINQ